VTNWYSCWKTKANTANNCSDLRSYNLCRGNNGIASVENPGGQSGQSNPQTADQSAHLFRGYQSRNRGTKYSKLCFTLRWTSWFTCRFSPKFLKIIGYCIPCLHCLHTQTDYYGSRLLLQTPSMAPSEFSRNNASCNCRSCSGSSFKNEMYDGICVRESICWGEGRKKVALKITICHETNCFSLIRMWPETSCKSVLYSWIRL